MWGEIPIIDSDEVGSQADAAEVDVVLGQDENDAGVEDAEVGTGGGSSVGDEDNMEGQDELVENMVVVEDKGEQDDDDSNHDEEDDEEGDKDNSDHADPQGEKPLENNSQDIKEDVAKALASYSEFKGTFGWAETHHNTPNPCLSITGIGTVGLPLSDRDATALIGVCRQVEGERQDQMVQNTWELSSSEISFENPSWHAWVQSVVVSKACEALGVGQDATATAELYKLLIDKTGSPFLPHQGTEEFPGMFATIVIVLPSKFTGGSLHLSHSGQMKTIDVAPLSSTTTSALAWYTDVCHAVHPILSGHRLSLLYKFMTSQVPEPFLPKLGPVIEKLKHVLLSWREYGGDEGVVEKLVYLLDHQYSQVGLRGDALKGSDARVLGLVQPIAEQMGFQIYMANLELAVHAIAPNGPPRGFKWNHGSGWGWNGEDDEDGMRIQKVTRSELKIGHTVDLDGIPVKILGIDIEQETELINGRLDDGKPDQREYNIYMLNGAPNLTSWYRRSALIIWPRAGDFVVEMQDITSFSDPELLSSTSAAPTSKESKLVEQMIKSCQKYSGDATLASQSCGILRTAAIRWRNFDLWLRALAIGKVDTGIEALTYAGFVEGLQAFGFRAMETFLDLVCKLEPLNGLCFGLLEHMANAARPEEKEVVQTWCETRLEWLLNHLRKPVPDDVEILARIVRSKGAEFVHNHIVPQIISLQPDSAFWTAFAQAFIAEHDTVLSVSPNGHSTSIIHETISHVVVAAIDSFKVLRAEDVTFFIGAAKLYGAGFVRDQILPQIVCLSEGDQGFWTAFSRKLTSEKYSIQDRGSFDSMLSDIVVATIDSFEIISPQDIEFLVELAKSHGVWIMRDIVLPNLAMIAVEQNVWASLLSRLYEARGCVRPDAEAVTSTISQFIEFSVNANPFPVKKSTSPSGAVMEPNVDAIVDLVLLCLSTDNEMAYQKLFEIMYSKFILDSAEREYRSTAYYIPLAKKLNASQVEGNEKLKMLSKTVSGLIPITVKSISAFPVKKDLSGARADVRSITELLQLCFSLDNPQACSAIFTKMQYAFYRLDTNAKGIKLQQYYIPLVQEIEKSLGRQAHKESFAPFYQVLTNMFYDLVIPTLGDLVSPTAAQVITITSIFKWHTGPLAVLKSDKLAAWVGSPSEKRLNTIKSLALVLASRRTAIMYARFDGTALDDIINTLALTAIDRTDLKPKPLPRPQSSLYGFYSQPPAHSLDFSTTLQLLQFCSNFSNDLILRNRLLQRMLVPHSKILMTDWITKYLMEFIPILAAHLASTKQDLTQAPYADFCVSAMRAFITLVLKSKPAEVELPNFGCGCQDCINLNGFFRDGDTTTIISKPLSIRTHLERELTKLRAFGITWVTIRAGSPHGLQVTKSGNIAELHLWRKRRAQGIAFLNKFGDDRRRRKIFGGEYKALISALEGVPLPPATPVVPVPAPNPGQPIPKSSKKPRPTLQPQAPARHVPLPQAVEPPATSASGSRPTKSPAQLKTQSTHRRAPRLPPPATPKVASKTAPDIPPALSPPPTLALGSPRSRSRANVPKRRKRTVHFDDWTEELRLPPPAKPKTPSKTAPDIPPAPGLPSTLALGSSQSRLRANVLKRKMRPVDSDDSAEEPRLPPPANPKIPSKTAPDIPPTPGPSSTLALGSSRSRFSIDIPKRRKLTSRPQPAPPPTYRDIPDPDDSTEESPAPRKRQKYNGPPPPAEDVIDLT